MFEQSYPVTIYVKQEDDGEEGTFLIASDDPSDFVEPGLAVEAAEYQLVRRGVVVESKVTVR